MDEVIFLKQAKDNTTIPNEVRRYLAAALNTINKLNKKISEYNLQQRGNIRTTTVAPQMGSDEMLNLIGLLHDIRDRFQKLYKNEKDETKKLLYGKIYDKLRIVIVKWQAKTASIASRKAA